MSKLYLLANSLINRITYWVFEKNVKMYDLGQYNDSEKTYIPVEDNTFYGDNIRGRHTANCCNKKVIEVPGKLRFGISKCDMCDLKDMVGDTTYATDDRCSNCPVKESMLSYSCYDSKYTTENQNALLTEIKSHYGIRHTYIN